MIIASRNICNSARSLLSRVVAESRVHAGLSINTPLLGLKQSNANAHTRHCGIYEAEHQRRYSSLARPERRRTTEDELTTVRGAHAAGKSAGEILELLGNRHTLQHLMKKAVGFRHAQRDLIATRTPTVSGWWSNAELEVLARGISKGKPIWRIAEELGRSSRSIESRAQRGFETSGPSRRWSTEDISSLRSLFDLGKSITQIARALHRTQGSVYA